MSDDRTAIEARRLRVEFRGRAVLGDLDVRLLRGECALLVGANGSGKTTLLGCLAALRRPTRGQVLWFGRDTRRDFQARRLVGLVGHQAALYGHLSLRENLLFAARMHGLPGPRDLADRWLESAGLRAWGHCEAARASRGMRQRAAIARALLHDPEIVLLDEPCSHLDAEGVAWLVDLLGRLHGRGRTICLATHQLEPVEALANRLLVLRRGRLEEQDLGLASSAGRRQARAA